MASCTFAFEEGREINQVVCLGGCLSLVAAVFIMETLKPAWGELFIPLAAGIGVWLGMRVRGRQLVRDAEMFAASEELKIYKDPNL